MRPPELHRIAIVMTSAIGDSVHVLPVINAIKRHSPGSRVTWFLERGPASLMRGHPAVDEIVEVALRGPLASRLREYARIRRELRGTRFDLVLDLQVALKAGILTSLLDAPVKLGFDRRRALDLNWLFTNERIPPHANQHVQDQYFEFLDHLGIPHDVVEWNLGPWPHERGIAERYLRDVTRPLASIAVSSSDPDRNWPADRWAAIIDALHERFGLQAMLVGGTSPAELEQQRVIKERARHQPLSSLGCSLRELVAVLHASALLLSPNTAPMHMAVALGRPVISLLATWDPRRTGPYRASQDLVIDAFHEPGDSDEITMAKKRGRMHLISVDDVLARVEVWNRSYR
jgi:heptosyltransferase I